LTNILSDAWRAANGAMSACAKSKVIQ
jgi:hypothetical protein